MKIRNDWIRLGSLTFIHSIVDSFPGMTGAILPAMREHFSLSLKTGVAIMSVLHIVCNFSQVFAGNLRRDKQKPLFIPIGVFLASTLALMGLLPQAGIYYSLSALMVISGIGIAITHPEALRAIHDIDETGINPSLATSIFMMGGFCGFASSGYFGSVLVQRWGLASLSCLVLLPVAGVFILSRSRITLAIDNPSKPKTNNGINFWLVFTAALPFNIAMMCLTQLVPSLLGEVGYSLKQGGIASMMFAAGSAFGSLGWSIIAKKIGQINTIIISVFSGLIFLFRYLAAIESNHIWMLLLVGFTTGSAFPFIVTIARNARGMVIGQRMGYIVGGAWGVASLVMIYAGRLAEHIGLQAVLNAMPWLFMLSGIFFAAISLYRKLCRNETV
ncbi:MAG: MFS transporter [Phycisphaerae bacterium]